MVAGRALAARGAIPEVLLGFDDQFDSGGNPWPVTTGISTDVGTNYWTFIGEEMASTYIDVWMGPGDFTLYSVGERNEGTGRRRHPRRARQ